MIKLTRPAAPKCLSPENVVSLTAEYKATEASVWNIPELKDALNGMSNYKCCYCETQLGTRGAMMEVEHYKPKKLYPDLVVEWDNLLPSCKRCNGKKWSHDVALEPIIKPCTMNPKLHLRFENLRYKGLTNEGRKTLEILEFNADIRFMIARYTLCLELENTLEDIHEDICSSHPDSKTMRRFSRRTMAALNQAHPDKAHSATLGAIILRSLSFKEIQKFLKKNSLWSLEFEDLLTQINTHALYT